MSAASRVVENVVCTACGCLCDDLTLHIDNEQIKQIDRACSRGDQWFRHHSTNVPTTEAIIDNRDVTLQEGIDAAANQLVAAKFPLVFGLSELSVEGQRAAIALADELGATLDSGAAADPMPAYFPTIGSMGCTWGEVIQRADLIVYWQCDVDQMQPRHRERVLDRALAHHECRVIHVKGIRHDAVDGESLPPSPYPLPPQSRGEREKTLDSTSNCAPEAVSISDDFQIESIWMLRALVQGKPLAAHPSADLVRLASALKLARYSVIIHSAEPRTTIPLQALATDVNRQSRCRLVTLAGAGNPTGQSEVCLWQTGYARSIGLHRGYPTSFGAEFSAQRLLENGEVDVVLSVGNAADEIGSEAQKGLQLVPQINISLGEPTKPDSAQIILFAAIPGIHASGTIFRSDRITLPLRPPFRSSFPDAELVLNRILEAVRSRRGPRA